MPEIDPQFLAALIVTVGAIVWLYNQLMVATGKTKKPQPFVVEAARKFATKEDHEELRQEVRINRQHTEERFKQLDDENKLDREKLYNRLSVIAEEVASQRKSDELTQATLARMDNKLDKLNERKADK